MTDAFIKALLEEIRIGYGIVPLIGSGFSAPSGIPIGMEFGDYLYCCLNRIIDGDLPWNPSDPVWPRFEAIDLSRSSERQKRDTALKRLQEWDKHKPNSGFTLEAIGALADWRATLTFLSRLRLKKPSTPPEFQLGAPDETIVDSAFIHVTKNRQPTLPHMMLAHCSDALRVQTILTTNFDTLIEEAFQRQGMHVTAFDVHQKARLPSAPLVLAQRSIVKLHGGRYGLRADYSLDEDPSSEDMNTFTRYFNPVTKTTDPQARKHLLVMGVSGSDSRTMHLIRAAAKTMPNLKVFWVCHRQPDKNWQSRIAQDLAIEPHRFSLVVHPEVGLLLLNLYQCHCISLPPSGADYPSVFLLPPSAYSEDRYEATRFQNQVKELQLTIAPEKPGDETRRDTGDKGDNGSKPTATEDQVDPPRLIAIDGERGVSSVAARVFDGNRGQCNTIWIELDHFANSADFLIGLVDAVVQRLGTTMVTPPIPKADAKSCRECLQKLVTGAHRPFLIFVNGRDGPGSGASWHDKVWPVKEQRKFWRDTERVIGALDKGDAALDHAIQIVVLTGNRGLTSAGRSDNWHTLPSPGDQESAFAEGCLNLSAEVIETAMCQVPPEHWSWAKRRFVFALTLFRQARYPAALTTWGLIKATKRLSDLEDNDEHRSRKCDEYIAWLEEQNAIRLQPGGMVWMHRDVRQRLYKRLLNSDKALQLEEPWCHQGIADWYVKLFRSSNDPHAALESLYHRMRCVELSRFLRLSKRPIQANELEITSLLEATETLKLARDRILASANLTTSSYIIEQVIQTIADDAHKVFDRHGELANVLAVTCEDVLRDLNRARGVADEPRDPIGVTVDATTARPRGDLRQLTVHRQDADVLLHSRRYAESARMFETFFENLGFERICFEMAATESDNSKLVQAMRGRAESWCLKPSKDGGGLRSNAEMQLSVKGLRGYMFLQMLMDQAHAWNQGGPDFSKPPRPESDSLAPRNRLRFAEGIYTLVTSVTRYIQDHDFLQVENTYIRTHAGILLAELKRFKEAHRRLNEATGYLSKSSKANDGLAWAIIDLRRAETYLYQARDEFQKVFGDANSSRRYKANDGEGSRDDWQRSAEAYLDDMRYALERAATRFVNHRKDVWWWTLHLELQLAYYAERQRQRICNSASSAAMLLLPSEIDDCIGIVRNGLQLFQSDGVRLARMLDLLMCLGCGQPPKKHGQDRDLENARVLKNELAEGYARLRTAKTTMIDCDLQGYIAQILSEAARRLKNS